MNKNKYIKSPLNYVGGKHKLLPQIIPLFPNNISTFYDIFGGGANVSVNVNADKIIYNDLSVQVVQILETFKKSDTTVLLSEIDNLIAKYNLSKTNKDGFLALRDTYNKSNKHNPIILYTLICYAFNNQIRFNNKGEYNMPFGKDRSSFNATLRDKFIKFCDVLHTKDIIFTNSDFREFEDIEFANSDFVYCDPPYFNSTATYNECNGWNEDDENRLYKFLNMLSNQNICWALSNNMTVNTLLQGFCDKFGYKIHKLNASYGNCNYHKTDKQSEDCEVLITNY